MKVTKQETLYHKDHGATLKHKCGKKDSSIVPFYFFSLFLGLSFFIWPFSFLGDNALLMMIITLLFIYNSMITTRYLEQNITLHGCLRRCTGMGIESRVTCMMNYAWWICHKYDVNYMIMQGNMTMMKRVIINEMVESCMAIYLRMAMEMP